MNDNIPLHPKLGLNPHLAVCELCGDETGEIILLGKYNRIYTCHNCGTKTIGPKNGTCSKCGIKLDMTKFTEIEEHQKLPHGLCDKCKEEENAVIKVAEEGGILWHCKCGAHGAMSKDNPLSAEVRKELGVEPPALCGIDLERCPACYKKE